MSDRFDAVADRLAERIGEMLDERDGAHGLLDAAAAARLLGVHRETIYSMVRAGRLPAIRLGDGPKARLRFDPKVLLDHLIQGDQRK